MFDLDTRRGWGVSVTPRPQLTPGKDPVPIAQEAGWASGPVWTGAENFASTGIRTRTVQPVGSHYTDYATRPKGCKVQVQLQTSGSHTSVLQDSCLLGCDNMQSVERFKTLRRVLIPSSLLVKQFLQNYPLSQNNVFVRISVFVQAEWTPCSHLLLTWLAKKQSELQGTLGTRLAANWHSGEHCAAYYRGYRPEWTADAIFQNKKILVLSFISNYFLLQLSYEDTLI
jgi:hypothetical protein